MRKTEVSEDVTQAVTNPKLIVEVLSPSTGLYDREGFRLTKKSNRFRSMY
ncbi:MAG: hypothetical protein QMB24_13190 [Spirosomataceae bacterium]